MKFRTAAERTGARTKHDGFDTAMIEVKNEDARPFMEELEHLTDEWIDNNQLFLIDSLFTIIFTIPKV